MTRSSPVSGSRILVTGGAGYIGSHTARLLAEAGNAVTVLDRVDAGFLRSIVDLEVVRGDVGDERLVTEVLRASGIEAVVHLAGDKSVDASLVDPGGYFANNTGGTLVLLRAMAAAGIGSFVFSSTCAVYGPDNEPPLTETSVALPETPYGASKLLVEQMLPWFERAHGVRSISLRYFNAAGASDDGRLGEDWSTAANLVPRVMKAAAGVTDHLTVFGRDWPTPDGTAIRDYVHVMDLARAHADAVGHLAGGGSSAILNLGTGRGASVLDVVRAAERASDREIRLEFAPRRPGDVAAVWADSQRAATVLGWRAAHDLDDIMSSAWRWHSQPARTTAAG